MSNRNRVPIGLMPDRLPTIFGPPTAAALCRAENASLAAGRMISATPSWIGHGQQLAARRLGERLLSRLAIPADRVTRQQRRHGDEPTDRLMPPAGDRRRPKKSRGPTGFDFSKCAKGRHLNSSVAKRAWRAKKAAA